MKNDKFANIAAEGIGGNYELLYTPEPAKRSAPKCNFKTEGIRPEFVPEKISTKEELYSELEILRKQYSPYLKNHAPEFKLLKTVTDIKNFRLNGQDITIPDYSGPSGYALKIYETEFESRSLSSDEAAYICFDGADYIAVVYINDICVGTHEGFFSPFEFDITRVINPGINTLKIELYNDAIYGDGGDKLYAATGLGWDDPKDGWHHCPPGIGIYNNVRYEIRNSLNITDVFVRPQCES